MRSVHYRCTDNHGVCELPRFREEEIAERLGDPPKGLQVSPEIVSKIVTRLREEQSQSPGKVSAERTRLESRLAPICNRMDVAYVDKLDRKVSEDLWGRKTSDRRMEEQRIKMAPQGLETADIVDRALDAQARLLRIPFSNCSVGAQM